MKSVSQLSNEEKSWDSGAKDALIESIKKFAKSVLAEAGS